jgi:hypothetical protein
MTHFGQYGEIIFFLKTVFLNLGNKGRVAAAYITRDIVENAEKIVFRAFTLRQPERIEAPFSQAFPPFGESADSFYRFFFQNTFWGKNSYMYSFRQGLPKGLFCYRGDLHGVPFLLCLVKLSIFLVCDVF